jgi:filamentous hemagglutinin
MKLKELVSHLVIDPRKLTEYALNLDNPVGSDKAVIFQRRLGFSQENYQLLLAQISAKTLDAAVLGLNDKHGHRYTVDLEILAAQGQQGIVRTGWIVEQGSNGGRLVTLFVRR